MPQGITRFTHADAEAWYQAEGRQVFLADVVDEKDDTSMSVGFARYGADQVNSWTVTYDEALVVTRGEYSVTSADGEKTTVGAGGVIYLREGTELTYSAGPEGADVVYVTHPHWMAAQRESEHAALLDDFHPVEGDDVSKGLA